MDKMANVAQRRHAGSYGHQHAVAAAVALEDRRRGHAHDRRVLTAVRTHRGQLETVQTIDAAVSAREVRRTQPRLAAIRAQWTEIDRIFLRCRLGVVHTCQSLPWEGSPTRRIRAMKKPAV
jgi:hypothetical protein